MSSTKSVTDILEELHDLTFSIFALSEEHIETIPSHLKQKLENLNSELADSSDLLHLKDQIIEIKEILENTYNVSGSPNSFEKEVIQDVLKDILDKCKIIDHLLKEQKVN